MTYLVVRELGSERTLPIAEPEVTVGRSRQNTVKLATEQASRQHCRLVKTEKGYRVLDACVLGNPFHARSGDLRVMIGGSADDVKELMPVFEAIGKQVLHVGDNGMGASMKLVLNLLMGIQMPALAEALVFGENLGLDRDDMLNLINGCGYSSPVMDFRCDIIGKRAFDFAAFKLRMLGRHEIEFTCHGAEKWPAREVLLWRMLRANTWSELFTT